MTVSVPNQITDQRIVQHDRSWQQFKLVQKGFEGSPSVRLTRCVLMAQTSRLEAARAFRKAISSP